MQQRIKRWSKKPLFSRKNDVQSLMVTDSALKLNYVSVIFVDPAVQINETQLDPLTTVAVCHTRGLR